jgi:hypothetical protein
VKKKNKMNSNKVALMLIAILAVGIFALPSTVSLFGGQHKWYDLGPAGNDIPCIKCHADTFAEFGGTGVHAMLGGGSTSNDSANMDAPNDACMWCHRLPSSTITFAEGDTGSATLGEEAHAASAVACMECHGYGFNFSEVNGTLGAAGFFAGGFKEMTSSSYSYTDPAVVGPGSYAAHNEFIQGAINDTMMTDSNEACIACHTYVAIDINWTHSYKMYFEADGRGGAWDVTNFDSEGCYNTTTYGNMSGNITSTTDPVVSISPEPINFNSDKP